VADFSQHRTLGTIALGLSIGIVLNVALELSTNLVFVLTIVLLGSFLLSNSKIISLLYGFLCALIIGMLLIGFRTDSRPLETSSGLIEIKELMSRSEFYDSYSATLLSEQHQKILLKIKTDTSELIPGDRFLFYGPIKKIEYPSLPGGFDYKTYLLKKGIQNQLTSPQLSSVKAKTAIRRRAYLLQMKLASRIQKFQFDSREQTTALALLVGYKDPGFKNLQNSYSKVGLSHLLALSGLHIAIVFSLIYLLLWPIGFVPKGKSIRWILSLLFLWAFALLSGWSYSVIRACLLLSFLGVSRLIGRINNSFHFLLLAFLTNLFFNPFALFQVGFQMSYTAVFFILWLHPILRIKLHHSNKIIDKVFELICLSLSAQIGVLPLILHYFGSFPLHFLIGNLLIVPLMGLLIYLGFISIFIGWTSFLFESFLCYINELIFKLSFDQLTYHQTIDSIQLVLLYGLIVSFIDALNTKNHKMLNLALSLVISFQFYSIFKSHQLRNREFLLITGDYKSTQLIYKKEQIFQIYSDSTLSNQQLNQLQTHFKINKTEFHKQAYAYRINQSTIVMIGKQYTYPRSVRTDLLVLTQNPKLHLGRLIDSLNPKLIIADKTNAPWNIKRWKATAQSKKIPLIDMRSEGYYIKDFDF